MMTFQKPEKRARTKRRKARVARQVVQSVRAQCVERDGYCRMWRDRGWAEICAGVSEWAHFDTHRRSKTRGQEPDKRHMTAGSLMLCTYHHREYDAHRLTITATTTRGCDGPLTYRRTV